MSNSDIQLDFPAEGVARIAICRPARANSLGPRELDAICESIDTAEQSNRVKVLLITGSGGIFSAGFDLNELAERLDATWEGGLFEDFAATVNRVESSRLVTVAAVNGSVAGGATDLALACDLRIGSDTSTFAMPAGRLGLTLYPDALRRYVARLGASQATRILLTAASMNAAQMLQTGFLSEVVSSAQLDERVMELARLIATMPAEPLAATKKVLNAIQNSDPASSTAYAQMLHDAIDKNEVRVHVRRALMNMGHGNSGEHEAT